MLRCSLVASVALVVVAVGCGSSGPRSGFDDSGNNDTPIGSTNGSDGGPGNPGSLGGNGNEDSGVGDTTDPPANVWGHSPDTLYKLDPNTKAVTVIGQFNGCTEVIDMALDQDSNMFVTTQDGFYKVDSATANCTQIALGNYPNSLSFVPAGTVDPNVEALVGYVGDQYTRIDTTSGAMSTIGSLGAGKDVVSSGDIVSVKNGPSYLTVTGGSSCTKEDCLVKVDPTTGAMTQNYGSIGYNSVFGLAFWAGTVYGFDDGGDLFSVTIDASNNLTTAIIPVPNAPANLEFWGAGSTTSAPPKGPN